MSQDPGALDGGPDAPLPVLARGGGELCVQPAGSAVAVPDTLLAAVERLEDIASALALHVSEARAARATAPWRSIPGSTPAAQRVDLALEALDLAIGGAERAAAELAARVREAAGRYDEAESAAWGLAQRVSALQAAGLGALLPLVALAAISPVTLLALVIGAPRLRELAGSLGQAIVANPRLITDPAFVEAVRIVASSSDDAALGALRAPAGVPVLLGEEGLGLTGTAFGAGVVIRLARVAGLLRETAVAVRRVPGADAAAAPEGAAERLERVPEVDQVRIERYDAPGLPTRWEVYVGPTETFSPIADEEPWDLTSNVTGVALDDAGSLRAVEQAMRDAGVQPGDAVQFTGFSQGGMIAARAAASGEWNAVGLMSFGGPTGTIDLPTGLDGMLVRHSDDLVPALGGIQKDTDLLQVERRAFRPEDPIPQKAAPAHQRFSYEATAMLLDRAESAEVREQLSRLDRFGAEYLEREGGTVTTYRYHADRV